MNSKLLYTYFRHEIKHNGEDKMENIHMGKKVTDCNIKQRMNLWKKHQLRLCNFIKELLKAYNEKITLVPTLSPSIGGEFIVFLVLLNQQLKTKDKRQK